jgi:type IV pilus assembly protein PilA
VLPSNSSNWQTFFAPEVQMESVCSACGNSVAAGERFCRVCGKAVSPDTVGIPSQPSPGIVVPAQTSGKAIASLVCGLLFFVPLAFIAAIIFGHIALSEIRKSAGRLKGDGLAIAGLVLGYMWVVAIPIVLIIAAIAIPNLLRARMAANESSALANIRTLTTVEITYASTHPNVGFTCSLSDLSADNLISNQLASGQRTGYVFELRNCNSEASGGPNTKYQVVAHPLTPNTTGIRAFCTDESNVIKVDPSGSASRCLEGGEPLQ